MSPHALHQHSGDGSLGLAALPPGWDLFQGRGDLSVQVCLGSRAWWTRPRATSPSGTEGPPAPGGGQSPEGWACKPFSALERAWGLLGAPRTPPEPCAVSTTLGSQPSPVLGEFCLLLQLKGFHLPRNQHRLKTKPPRSAPSHQDACPSGPAPWGAPFRGEPGQLALPSSRVSCVSRRTPSAGFKADDHQFRQSQGRGFRALLLTPNDTGEQAQRLWKVPRLPQQAGGLKGTRAARPQAAGNHPGPPSGWRARPQENCFWEEVHPLVQFWLMSKFREYERL